MKWQNKAKYLIRLEFEKKTSNPSKVLHTLITARRAAPELLEALAILQIQLSQHLIMIEKTWNHTENQEKKMFLEVIDRLIICKFFKDFTNHGKETVRTLLFSCRPHPNTFTYRNLKSDFPTTWRIRFIETYIERFSYYVWKLRLTFLQNCQLQPGVFKE